MANNKTTTAPIRSNLSSLRQKQSGRTKSCWTSRTTLTLTATRTTTKCCQHQQHRERPPDNKNAELKTCPNMMTPSESPPPSSPPSPPPASDNVELNNLAKNLTAENSKEKSHENTSQQVLQCRSSVQQSTNNQSTGKGGGVDVGHKSKSLRYSGKHSNDTTTPIAVASLRQSQEPKQTNAIEGRRRWCRLLPQTVITILRHILSQQQQHQQSPLTSPAVTTTTTATTTSSATMPRCSRNRNRNRSISSIKTQRTKFRLLPTLGATSFVTLLTLICLETVLLSTMSTCAKTFYMHWNTSNSIFRIDNTDHIIDVNKGNLAFEFDQVHIICPVYEPGTYENETEKYIIYNVSKVEYETCRITNADPRVIAICDKPQKLMFFTITFRPFTPQPGGLEFLPGNDYYFISTSSKDDLYRRIGGRCSTNNMKVVFKVCCAPEEKNKTAPPTTAISAGAGSGSGGAGAAEAGVGVDDNNSAGGNIDTSTNINQGGGGGHHHMNNINNIGINGVNPVLMPGANIGGGVQLKPINGMGTSINSNIDQFNRIPIQPNVIGGNFVGGIGGATGVGGGGGGIMLSPGHMLPPTRGGGSVSIAQYPGHHHVQTGIRINNVPTQQQYYPPHKGSISNDDHHYNKHPNEVVKNEELTYNSGAASKVLKQHAISWQHLTKLIALFSSLTTTTTTNTQQTTEQQQHYHMLKETTVDVDVDPTKHFLCYKCSELTVKLKVFIRNLLMSLHPLILLPILAKLLIDCMCKYTLRASAAIPKQQQQQHHHRTKYLNIHNKTNAVPVLPADISQLSHVGGDSDGDGGDNGTQTKCKSNAESDCR